MEPSQFLPPEPLHHWHKAFWDHDAKWCIRAIGDEEIDLRFSLLQPCVGFRHFKAGISLLKQVTGRDHRNVQRYIVPIIAGAVPKEFVLCIRALSDFQYLAQSHSINNHTLSDISDALALFHRYKQAILDAGARVRTGNNPLDHFFIPKLELLHSVVTSVCWSGPPIQWLADPTERAHINVIKVPSGNTNNGQYAPQICRHLDRDKKRQLFNLCTAIREAGGDLESIIYKNAGNESDTNETPDDEFDEDWVAELDTVGSVCGPSRKTIDLFAVANALAIHAISEDSANIVRPFRTFSTPWAAFNLGRRPDIPQISVDSLADKYNLPDLCPSLIDFLSKYSRNISAHRILGRRQSWADFQLPFDNVMVWHSLRLQTNSLDNDSVTEPQRLMAHPPCDTWPLGRYDSILFSHDSTNPMPSPDVGLDGSSKNKTHLLHL